MYLKCLLDIPIVPGKLVERVNGSTTYILYEYGRTYDKVTQHTTPRRAVIGKKSKADPTKMQPNHNFLIHFPDVEIPEERHDEKGEHSSCLRIGTYLVIRKILAEYGIPETLDKYMSPKERGLFLDFLTYSIVTENNAGQYYPDYAYNHPLFTQKMKRYSDSTLCNFFKGLTDDQRTGFLNEWNAKMDHREKIYISYDSTNKNIQAGDLEIAEFGHAKNDRNLPIFNYAVAYDTNNKVPVFYEDYPGSINDVSQLKTMVDKAEGYGYKKVGFILDRGYFSKENIEHMDRKGYSFIMMVKGMADLVNGLILKNKGTFEARRANYIRGFEVYGKTIEAKLYETDQKKRYIHIFHSIEKEADERKKVEDKIERLKKSLEKKEYTKTEIKGSIFEKYFDLYYGEDGTFRLAAERDPVIEWELSICGYFAIVTSEKMTAKEALMIYKSRDVSEKLFRADKSFLGNDAMRVSSDESVEAKTFIEFVALIVRSRMYVLLQEEMQRQEKKSNYMTVPAAVRELEKIEIVRQLDNAYRLDRAVTANQKAILQAFGMDSKYVKNRIEELSNAMKNHIEL